MATKPKRREAEVTADARHVAAAARRHLSMFEAADAGRSKKLLPLDRLAAFEGSIAALEVAMGRQITTRAVTMGATAVLDVQRRTLREKLRDLRDEVRLGHREDPSIGRAFGVGRRLGQKSTPEVLAVAEGVLATWKEPEFRAAAMAVGVTEARIEEVRELTRALGQAGVKRGLLQGRGHGRTRLKQELLEKVRAETVYLRGVAQVVLRRQPEVLVEFASPLPRRRVRTGERAGKQAESLPLSVGRSPSLGEMTPSLMEGVPSRAEAVPSRMDGSPSFGEGSPSGMEMVPSRGDGSPSRVKGSSSRGEGARGGAAGGEGQGPGAERRGRPSERGVKPAAAGAVGRRDECAAPDRRRGRWAGSAG